MEDDVRVLVCAPKSMMPTPPASRSITQNCSQCNEEVWVSPEGLIQAGVSAKILCMVCAKPHLEDENNPIIQPSDKGFEVIKRETGDDKQTAIRRMNKIFGRDMEKEK